MTHEAFDHYHGHAINIAKRQFDAFASNDAENQGLAPILLALCEGDDGSVLPLVIPVRLERDRAQRSRVFREAGSAAFVSAKKNGMEVAGLFFTAESWRLTVPDGTDVPAWIDTSPNKEECLSVSGSTADGYMVSVTIPILRTTAGEPTLGEIRSDEPTESALFDAFWEAAKRVTP